MYKLTQHTSFAHIKINQTFIKRKFTMTFKKPIDVNLVKSFLAKSLTFLRFEIEIPNLLE